MLFFFPTRKEQEEQAVGATYCEKIDGLLQRADFVMVVVSLTPQTHKLIGKREMELMKPTATLINISRGTIHNRWLAWRESTSQLPVRYPQRHAASTAQLAHAARTDQGWQKFSSLPFCSLSTLRTLPANGTQRHSYSKPGAVVDQEALVTALQTGVIRAAALGVTYPEPLPRFAISAYFSERMGEPSQRQAASLQQAGIWQRHPHPPLGWRFA